MNYYAQGGQAHGLKSLAQELPNYGRYGDDMVAHISSDEARMLQAMGGSGTINPQTGLPEFFKIGNVFKPIQQAIGQTNPFNPGSAAGKAVGAIPGVKEAQNLGTQVFQPLEKAVVQPASRGLASFDKAVGNTIPGGWGTVAATAARFVPVIGPALSVGISALNSSGVLRKGGSFNLKGAMIGGATAYAAGKLADYAAAAGGAGQGPELLAGGEGAVAPMGGASGAAVIPESTMPQLLNAAPYESAIPQASFSPSLDAGYYDVAPTMSTSPSFDPGYMDVGPVAPSAPASANIAPEVLQQVGGPGSPNFPSVGRQIMSGEFSDAARQIGSKISDIPGDLYQAGVNAKDAVVNYDYSKGLEQYGKNVSQTGAGIKNLLGAGDITQKEAIALASKTGINPQLAAAGTVYGVMSLSDLDAQRDFLNQQKAAGNIAQAEYDQALAEINRQRDYAAGVVKDSPFSTNPDRDVSIGETFYGRGGSEDTLYGRGDAGTTLYAMGGSIDDEYGMDEARGMMQGNLQKGLFGQGYAAGGTPRFLSGGGDGMSDDIPATINNNQPARLADGEFVVPADVVSHIGNGSSKAGAKQLYSMMNKVRKARTGNPKQGKQINPSKYLPA
jgi:hypothetical protein